MAHMDHHNKAFARLPVLKHYTGINVFKLIHRLAPTETTCMYIYDSHVLEI